MKNTKINYKHFKLQDTEDWFFSADDQITIYEAQDVVYKNVNQVGFFDFTDGVYEFDFDMKNVLLPSLKSIMIHGNEISMADKFFNMINPQSFNQLEELALILSSESVTKLPAWLGHCNNLRTFNVSTRGLSYLPEDL